MEKISAATPAPTLARPVYIIAVLSFCGGNLLSYTPINSIENGLTNATQVAEWSADLSHAPLAFKAFVYGLLLNFLGLLVLPCLAVTVYTGRKKDAPSWYGQYCNSPGQSWMMLLLYVCLWGFAGHVIQLVVAYDCDICMGPLNGKDWPSKFSVVAEYYPSAFWLHAVPAGVISLLSPFQLTEKVRKWNNFQAHRWIGRIVLLASCVHQTSATYLTISNLFFNRHHFFPTSWMANTVYALAFVPFNIYTWTATIQGWRCARLGRIKEHTAWMYRLSGMWVIVVVLFRWANGIFSVFLGQEWGIAVHVWFAFCWTIPLELFIQKSGRFVWSKSGKVVNAREVDQMQCPFLRVSGDDQGTCPFSVTRNA